VHFLCLEPYETDKNVLKFTKNLVLKFHFLLLGALITGVMACNLQMTDCVECALQEFCCDKLNC